MTSADSNQLTRRWRKKSECTLSQVSPGPADWSSSRPGQRCNAGPERGDRERTQMAIKDEARIPVISVPMKPLMA
jgi:hypothetical protein